MQDHSLRGALAWCLVFLVIVQQVSCSPLPQSDTPSSVQEVQRSLKRTARMTPLWRIMGEATVPTANQLTPKMKTPPLLSDLTFLHHHA
ncbi:liver-expressed antimicrobial peptide 2 isoform X2 [Pseudorasbora parva]|uniref:liver-expressed antimicrobial peptide 2 isoform X2 n=1 Tax=Pseudorasbora parva TaxID=51549 RepID=UPI00351E453B